MSYVVDFTNVSTVGLESSPVATALAGLRANEARYFKNKYDHDFTVEPASEAEGDHRLGAPDPEGGARPRHRVAPARGDRSSRSRTSGGRTCSTRAACRSTCCTRSMTAGSGPSASSSPTAWRSPPSSLVVQVREAEVEARRDHPRLVLRDQGRVLTRVAVALDPDRVRVTGRSAERVDGRLRWLAASNRDGTAHRPGRPRPRTRSRMHAWGCRRTAVDHA